MRDVDGFLSEYKQLCEKYLLEVDSCGCCNSPFLTELDDTTSLDGSIEHLRESA